MNVTFHFRDVEGDASGRGCGRPDEGATGVGWPNRAGCRAIGGDAVPGRSGADALDVGTDVFEEAELI